MPGWSRQITVLVATGLHRPNEGEELAALVGDPWVLETVRVENHFTREDEDHMLVGTTDAVPWYASTGVSQTPTCASPSARWSRTSWPAGPAGAR